MGFIQKKDSEEHDVIEGIEVIERSDTPDDVPASEVEVVERDEDAEADDADTDADEKADEAADAVDDALDGKRPPVVPIAIACAVIAVVIAAVVGYMVGSGGFAQRGISAGTLTENQLDNVIAAYTLNGAKHDITAREAIESQYELEAAKLDDGTYETPSADTILTYVRNKVLCADAEARGIELSDDELTEFAETTLGDSDFASIAESYNVSEDQAREIVRENALINKLYAQIAPEASGVEEPEKPAEPADGDTSAATAEYAAYIIDLLGDEWDAETGTWARTDGPYYAALSEEDFTQDAATYEQAMMAYYVAYQDYYAQVGDAQSAWRTYVNGLYADVELDLYGINQ